MGLRGQGDYLNFALEGGGEIRDDYQGIFHVLGPVGRRNQYPLPPDMPYDARLVARMLF